MPAAIWTAFEERCGVGIVEFYGAAEGGITVRPRGAGPVGCIGKPVPILQHRIVDDDGNDCAKGEPGELLFRPADGSPFNVEYVGNPDGAAKKCKDGWLHMGDVVREDENGWLFFEYRKGGGIRHNGEFINPAPIEKAIAESGAVEDVYVYGVKAASGAPGEKDVVAAVVPNRTHDVDPHEVCRTCRTKLERTPIVSSGQRVARSPQLGHVKP